MSIFEILKKYCTIDEMPYFAIDQGMVGLLYDEVRQMSEYPFDEEGFAQMVMHAEKLKKDWVDQKNNINTLANLCKKKGLKMLVFKGYAMSLLYDRPESRKMGDVDVFFFKEGSLYPRFPLKGEELKASPKSSPEGKDLRIKENIENTIRFNKISRPTGEGVNSELPTICAGDEVDEVVRGLGVEVTPGWKHTTFEVRGTHVENHRHFVGWKEHKRLIAAEKYLLGQIFGNSYDTDNQDSQNKNTTATTCTTNNIHKTNSETIPNQGTLNVVDVVDVVFDKNVRSNANNLVQSDEWKEVYFPSANFNAVLLAIHMGEHFVYEGACLRHLVDWAVFLDKCGEKVDWKNVYALADTCGYRKWLDVLNAIAMDYFGVSQDKTGTSNSYSTGIKELEEKVMKELAESKPFDRDAREHHFWKYMWGRTKMAIRDRWKLRMVYNENSFLWYCRHAISFVMNKDTE